MKCKHCGEEIANDSRFCEFCGTKIKKRGLPWWAILLIVIGVLGIASIVVILALGSNNNTAVNDPVPYEEYHISYGQGDYVEDKDYILTKAREAGQAKCNCYKTDPTVVEQCFKTIMDQNYAAYKDDADFQAEMKAEYNRCLKRKILTTSYQQ